ncbi:nucleotidyl transferase AbiEii/AbiGii toxin family protein [Halovenus halobia]|uniref:nucleotidyl transferase AbiEii/AbiGii toxin family protein n=1 Tax=Halovenus halobia TaxID=3396622 RepID=UPI003F571FD9
MVRQYYVDQVTELSEQELQSVFHVAEPPVCLLGGWAVHLHVNPQFEAEHGRQYIGSRDIDLGVHVNPDWTQENLPDTPVGKSVTLIEELGYTKSRFGFVQNFHRDNGDRISEEEASQYDMHEIFQVYIDLIPDTAELEQFREVFGFKPPAEPLLKPVFQDDEGDPLTDHVSWEAPGDVKIVPPEILAAMKTRSLPDRDKSHKRVKDVADLHALLWYAKDYNQIKSDLLKRTSEEDINRLEHTVDEELFENAAQLLQINPEIIENSITRLFL